MATPFLSDSDFQLVIRRRPPIPAMLMLDPAGETVLVHRGTLTIRDELRVTAAQITALLKAGAMDGR